MGNSISEISDRVSSLSISDLKASYPSDLTLASYDEEYYDPVLLQSISSLSNFPILQPTPLAQPPDLLEHELSSAFSYSKSKHDSLKSLLIASISSSIPSNPLNEIYSRRLQAFCATFEAIYRQDKLKDKLLENGGEKKALVSDLPVSAQLGVSFGVSSLVIMLKKCIAGDAEMYLELVNETSALLSQFQPMSCVVADPVIERALLKISGFFESILRGEIKGISLENQLASLSPLFGISLVSGSISAALSIVLKLLTGINDKIFTNFLPYLMPHVKSLSKAANSKFISFEFESAPSFKQNSNKTLASGEANSIATGEVFSKGSRYYEVMIEKLNGSVSIGICDGKYTEKHIRYCSDGNILNIEKSSTGAAVAVKEKLGIFVNFDGKTVAFYKDKAVVAGPFRFEFESARIFVGFNANDCEVKMLNPEMPENLPPGVNIYEDTTPLHALFTSLQANEKKIDLTKISSPLLAGFILALLNKINEKHRVLLEKYGKSTEIKAKEPLSIDIREQTVDCLYKIIQLASTPKFDPELSSIILHSSLEILRSHLLALRIFPQIHISSELKKSLQTSMQDLIQSKQKLIVKECAAKVLSMCLEVFFSNPQDQIPFLEKILKDYKNSFKLSNDDGQIIEKIIEDISQPFLLFDAFAIESKSDEVKQFMVLLIEIFEELSIRSLKLKTNLSIISRFVNTAIKCLISQFAKVGFSPSSQAVILSISQKLISSCLNFIKELKSCNLEISIAAKDTIIYTLPSNYFTALVLCKLDLTFITEILEPSLSLVNDLKFIPVTAPEIMNTTTLISNIFESDHPYRDNFEITKVFKVPYALKYSISCDPNCLTEANCDFLKVFSDESKSNLLYTWSGNTFPTQEIEIPAPVCCFEFKSDSSNTYWGYKVNVKAEVKTKFPKCIWPGDLNTSLKIFIASCCKKLIRFEFEDHKSSDEVSSIVNSPLCKYGIRDSILGVFGVQASLPEKMIALASSPVIKRQELTGLSKKLLLKEADAKNSLVSYSVGFGKWTKKYSDIDVIEELFVGSDNAISCWRDLKQTSGVKGPSSSIGGADLNQAERAVFAVLVCIFDITDSLNNVFLKSIDVSNSLKYIVKQSCSIRTWAQKRKQELIDSGKVVGYTDIGKEVLEKCALLLKSEYRKGLIAAGVHLQLTELTQFIKSQPSISQAGSKWKTVKGAVSSIQKLGSLLSISKPKVQNQDTTEITKVWNMLLIIFNNNLSAEEIVKTLDERRIRGLSRALGYRYLNIVLSDSVEPEIVDIFNKCVTSEAGKEEMAKGLEATDPTLITCVQSIFYSAYKLLISAISEITINSIIDLNNLLNLIESVNYPISESDLHYCYDLNLTGLIRKLLEWSKGNFGNIKISKVFSCEHCVTSFKLLTEPQEGAFAVLGADNLYLLCNKAENVLPIVEFVIQDTVVNGFEDAVGPVVINGETKYFLIKRASASNGLLYLSGISEAFEPKFEPYSRFQTQEDSEELSKVSELKQKISEVSFKCLKFFMLSLTTPALQETIINEVFIEFKDVNSSFSLSLDETCSGCTWIGKINAPTNLQRNPVERFLKKFYKEADAELPLRKIVETHVRAVDHGLKGVLNAEDEAILSENAKKMINKHKEFRNSRGEVDFFRFLNSIYEKKEDLDDKSKEYMGRTKVFLNIPYDFYDAAAQSSLANVSNMIMYAMSQSSSSDFTTLLGGFVESEIAGICKSGAFPEEFKNSEGNFDFYLLINKISSDPDKYPQYHPDVSLLINEFGSFPASCLALNAEQILIEDYQGTLMWLLFSVCGLDSVQKSLCRRSRIQSLILKAISSSQELSALSMLILSRLIPSQHSFESLQPIWSEISSSSGATKEVCKDFATYLFSLLGTSAGYYLQTSNWKKVKRSSMDALEMIKRLVDNQRWKVKVSEIVKENIIELNKKLEQGIRVNEVEAGVLAFLAMSTANCTGLDYLLQPLMKVKFDQASTPEGVIWSINDDACKVFNIESSIFVTESLAKVSGVMQPSSFFKDSSNPEIFELLLKTWKLIQEFKQQNVSKSAKAALGSRIVMKRIESWALESLVTVSDNKQKINREKIPNGMMWKKFLTVKELMAEKVESKVKAEVTKQLSSEEITARINGLDQDKQVVLAEVASLGYQSNLILAAIDAGCKTSAEIIENIMSGSEPKAIFALSKWQESELDIIDLSDTGEFYQSSKGHMIISTDSSSQDKKVYSVNINDNIFHKTQGFIESLTFFVCIAGTALTHKCEFGLKIGELDIKFESVVEMTQIDIMSKFSFTVLTASHYAFKIFASVNGDLELIGDSFEMRLNLNELSVFNGSRVGNLSLYMKEGGKAELKGFSIYEGRLEKTIKFFEEDLESKESFGKLVRTRVIESGFTENRLKLIGMPEKLAKNYATQYCDLEKTIQEAVKVDSSSWPDTDCEISSRFVSSVKIFDSVEAIEKGYTEVQTLSNGEPSNILSTYRKVVAIKVLDQASSAKLVGIVLDQTDGYELVGDMAKESAQEPQNLYARYSEKGECIKDLLIITTKSPIKVSLPAGYQLLCNKEGSSINLSLKAEKNIYVFIAYTKSDIFISIPVHLLSSIEQPVTDYGLANTTEAKKESEDSDNFKSSSILELVNSLLDLEEQRIQNAGRDFMLSISAHKPEALVSSAESKGVAYLLGMFDSDYSPLIPFINAAISGNNKSVVEKILAECVFQLISACSGSFENFDGKMYETAHPYSNGIDLDEEIYVPGASKLIFTFDSQCYTEANCDYLVFYRQSGRQDEIKRFTGQGESIWQTFEIPGDRVFMYFHTDSSVTYWGYKLKVKAVMPAKKAHQRKLNIPGILFIIDYISKQNRSGLIEKFFKKEIILPLFALLHTTLSPTIISQILKVFQRLLTAEEAYQKSIFRILLAQTSKIVSSATGNKSLVIDLLSLLCGAHESGKYLIKDSWFTSFYNCYYDMKDFLRPSGGLGIFLFESFKKSLANPIERIFESTHPYSRDLKSEQVNFPGASSLSVVFDPNSELDEGDEIFCSLDQQAKQHINTSSDAEVDIKWNNEVKGPDILISNGGSTVTRTNSSSWGTVISSSLITASVKIVVKIDNMDSSDYLYIGLMDAENTNLSSYLGNDVGFKVWTWKRNGDFMRQGETVSKGSACAYVVGDTIEFNINYSEHTISYWKNGESLHVFTEIGEKLRFAACFGGSSQVISILSSSETGASWGNIKKRKFDVNSDSFYLHFPVNQGIYDSFKWEGTNESSISVTPSVIKRNSGEGPSVHFVQPAMTLGRHYCEFEFLSLPEKSLAVLFVAKESISRTQSVLGTCAGYKSLGNIMVGANSTSCKGYKSGDIIGIFFDYNKNEVRYYKNKLLVASCKLEVLAEGYYFGVMLTQAGQELRVIKSEAPDDVDMLGNRLQLRYGQATKWGYKLKVIPNYSQRNSNLLENIIKQMSEKDKVRWTEYYQKFSSFIRNGAAEELVTLIDEISVSSGKASLSLENADVNPQPDKLIYYKHLEKLQVPDIQELYRIIQVLNVDVKNNLELFDLNIAENPDQFQQAFLHCRKFIFFDLKKTVFNTQLGKSKNDSRPEITIDRTKAMRYRSQGKIDSLGQFSVFGQVLRLMNQRNNTEFRNSERIFRVTYKGEGAIDAGGPYNEVISNMCDELQSSFLPLLTATQNHTNNTGDFRDAWTVNPSDIENGLEMFAFFGKLIGAAIRTQNNLNLSLAPMTWKKIVVEPINNLDLKTIDEICYQTIEFMQDLEAKGITKDNFSSTFGDLDFTVRLSNGQVVDVAKGGKGMIVNFENSAEYARCVAAARLEEGDRWYKAIRSGISAVIPINLLNLFSWRQVETLVCGAIDVNVAILRANTEYTGGTNESDPHIAYFWEVLTEMSPKERQLYLKFVWGRTRLPASNTFTHMKISKLTPSGPVDKYLPVTHTCFFTIDLPPYNSKEVMRNKLVYAITHCVAIDLDTTPSGGWDDNE